MKFNGKLLGLIGGFMGLWAGITFALTAMLGSTEINGLWFGIFGAVMGLSCAIIGMMIHYLNKHQHN